MMFELPGECDIVVKYFELDDDEGQPLGEWGFPGCPSYSRGNMCSCTFSPLVWRGTHESYSQTGHTARSPS
jgi:hypothetical protein